MYSFGSVKKVLIIEDNAALRENTAELLEMEGYKTFTAENGKVGFELSKQNLPDAVLCDIIMPESDGVTFFQLTKENKSTAHIPIISFSAGSAPNVVKKGQ